jgi:hypothetical protein
MKYLHTSLRTTTPLEREATNALGVLPDTAKTAAQERQAGRWVGFSAKDLMGTTPAHPSKNYTLLAFKVALPKLIAP